MGSPDHGRMVGHHQLRAGDLVAGGRALHGRLERTDVIRRDVHHVKKVPLPAQVSHGEPCAPRTPQRTVGNQAVVEVLQRQRGGGAQGGGPRLPPPTRDQIVAEMGSTLGGPFDSYSAYAASMREGSFLGHTIARGVRPEFLVKLARAEGTIKTEYAAAAARRRDLEHRRLPEWRLAALKSNHSAGTAMDMTFDFGGNKKDEISYELDGRTVTRRIKVDDEARTGQNNRGRVIPGIRNRELTKAGADFGVHRALDNDIVHWSRTGR